MKKFLLFTCLIGMLSVSTQAQVVCPVSYKRNNGNNCVAYGTGGSISFKFSGTQSPNLQIHTLVIVTADGPVLSNVVESSKVVSGGGTEIEWCFENSNIPPVSKSLNYQATFYLDNNLNFQFDQGEPQSLCPPSQGPLPVIFKQFDAEKKSNSVLLSWETASEQDNRGFEIERKNEDGAFVKVGFVASKASQGNGSGYSYQYEDNSALKGRVLYRIRQVDFSGSYMYSDIKTVMTGNGALKILAYPNPNNGQFNMAIPSGIGKTDIRLERITGELVQAWSGNSLTKISVSNLSKGLYLLRGRVAESGETFVERIVVQ